MNSDPVNATEVMLRKFHAEHPGATSAVCAARTPRGSSYERLANLVPHTKESLTVLDLACGDGTLLALLRERHDADMKLVGVDMSPDELRLARQRLGEGAELRLERAQDLSLPDASFDYVLCHLALMLMDPVEPVVAQVARVLKPGGVFGAVVDGTEVRGDAWEAFVSAASELLRREGGLFSVGDRRAHSLEGLRKLFNPTTGFDEPIVTEEFVLALDGTIEEVKQRLSLTYFVTMLSPEGLRELDGLLDGLLGPYVRADGTIPCSLGLRSIACRKAR